RRTGLPHGHRPVVPAPRLHRCAVAPGRRTRLRRGARRGGDSPRGPLGDRRRGPHAYAEPGGVMLRLGFACHWDQVRERTWSGTPWRLREALGGDPTIDVVDVAPTIAGPVRRGLRLAGARISEGRVRSHWRHSAAAVNLIEADLERRVRRAAPDVVLQIQ